MKKADQYSLYLAGLSSDYSLNESAPPVAPTEPAQSQEIIKIKNKLMNAVDVWVKQILGMLKSPSTGQQMGLWDRFKSGVSNLYWGRDNRHNPNYWRNRYGDDLGVPHKQESLASKLTFKEYHSLKTIVDKLESKINTLLEAKFDDLKIAQMIRQAGEQLKKSLSDIVDGKPTNSPSGGPGKPPGGNPPGSAGATVVPPDGSNDSDGSRGSDPSGGPSGGGPGNPPRNAGATANKSATGGSSPDAPDSPDDPDNPGGPGPDDKGDVAEVLKQIPQISANYEKYVKLMADANIKNQVDLAKVCKEIYESAKSGLEKLGKPIPDFVNLFGSITYYVALKLEHGEANVMKDLISHFLIGYLVITDGGKDHEKVKGIDFMSVVDQAKKMLASS